MGVRTDPLAAAPTVDSNQLSVTAGYTILASETLHLYHR